jgi:hypothetical protein
MVVLKTYLFKITILLYEKTDQERKRRDKDEVGLF